MEATAVSLARFVLDGVLSSARSTLTDEAALLLGVPKEVEFIRKELEMMQSALRDVSAAHPVNHTVDTSVKQLRDLAYDFEDCLLDFALYRDRHPSSSSSPTRLAPAALSERHRIAAQVRDLKAGVEAQAQRDLRYRIFADLPRPNTHTSSADDHDDDMAMPMPMLHMHPSPSSADEIAFRESDVIGRRHEKVKLTRLVEPAGVVHAHHEDDDDPSTSSGGGGAAVSVVAVWGMGGMGKSSLVRMVHGDPELLAGFDCAAWVTVPHPLDGAAADAFRRRLRAELGMEPGHRIWEFLREKRYLVVVDDLQTREEWDTIWSLFRFHNDRDSRIIVTTRWEDLARHCEAAGHAPDGHELIYELKPMEEEESKSLLCQKVYKKSDYPLPPDMKEQASYILRKCRGLPLAICTIGGFLASRPKTSTEWRNLHEHLGVELESELHDIKKVILSSYNGLPYHLKSIFLYLSIFPENHEIRRTRLLRRWMAEGYIAKRRDMLVEDLAARFYNELISRSMIQGSKASRGVGVDRCQVHSMVREIILKRFIEENNLFLIEEHSNDIPQSKVRHLVVSRWKSGGEKLQNINLSFIRSLTIFGECPASLISPKLLRLRVLDLEDTINLKNSDLEHIGELRHLRYLSLRGTDTSKLPSSLQNLRYLETLDIQDTQVTQLPSGIAKLEKLCYLLAGTNFSKDLLRNKHNGKDSLLPCLCCNCNPGECCKVFNLSVSAPEGIEKLQNLHMLGVVNVGNGNGVAGRLKKLTNLTNLRRLGVAGLTEKEGKDLCQSIGELKQLRRLEVRSDSLAFLAQTPQKIPRYLDSLRLCGNLSSLPKWISSLNDLARVKLLGTQLKREDIQHLQNLPNLTLLGLWEKSYIGNSLYFCTGTFLKLKFLDIDGLDEINEVTIEKDTMPKLKKLWLNKCPSLHDNNSGLSGVPHLLNLNELVLKKCGKKENLLKILQRQVSDHKNRPKLLVGKSLVLRAHPRTPTADP
ncbi:unnamed protein product [Urochloa humidicola]